MHDYNLPVFRSVSRNWRTQLASSSRLKLLMNSLARIDRFTTATRRYCFFFSSPSWSSSFPNIYHLFPILRVRSGFTGRFGTRWRLVKVFYEWPMDPTVFHHCERLASFPVHIFASEYALCCRQNYFVDTNARISRGRALRSTLFPRDKLLIENFTWHGKLYGKR